VAEGEEEVVAPPAAAVSVEVVEVAGAEASFFFV